MILTRVVFYYFDSIQEIIPHIEIHSTLHKKWMNFENSSVQLFWSIHESTPHIEIHSTLHEKCMILKRALFNYSDEFKKLSYTLRFIAHDIRDEWFWPRLVFDYFDQFKKLSHTLRFIEHYMRNEWFSLEFCSTILMNSRNYPTHWNS